MIDKTFRSGYRVIYLGKHWQEIINPHNSNAVYREALTFWAKTAKAQGVKMKVVNLPTYLDVHSYNRSNGEQS